ncbi:MAG: arnC [Solirubrobacterales bacterium]|nr:arnC [Solirubrobacterales bacterium]
MSARLARARALLVRVPALARPHALFLALVAVGGALRTLAWLAYQPALIYPDSIAYLQNAANLQPYKTRPLGYPAMLRILPDLHDLALIPAVQHAMGIGIAVLLYVLLLRLGVPRWGAALATAPALLDAYLVNIEEYILSETLFHALIVGAIVALLWRRRPGIGAAALAGLLLAAATVTRASGEFVIVPAILAVLFLRAGKFPVVALVLAFAVPVVGYMAWFHSTNGTWGITSYGGQFLYARVAPFADCSKFSVPANERVLCPTQPVGQRPAPEGSVVEFYMWDRQHSPVYRISPENRRTRLAGDFAKRVILNQPFTYLGKVAHDFLRGFAPIRTRHHGELPIARWQFQATYPHISPFDNKEIRLHGGTYGKVRPRMARFLRSYQRFGFVPGPILAASLLLGIVAMLGVSRARGSGARTSTFLFTAMAVLVFGLSVVANQFTWRYQLSLIVLLPPAGALALTALRRRPVERDGEEPGSEVPHKVLRLPR